jgi:hypothetical protein
VKRSIRSPVWSPDGKLVIYEKVGFKAGRSSSRSTAGTRLGIPPHRRLPGPGQRRHLAITEKQLGNSSIVTMKRDGSDRRVVFRRQRQGPGSGAGQEGPGRRLPARLVARQPVDRLRPGIWFQERARGKATLMRVRRDGTGLEP